LIDKVRNEVVKVIVIRSLKIGMKEDEIQSSFAGTYLEIAEAMFVSVAEEGLEKQYADTARRLATACEGAFVHIAKLRADLMTQKTP